MNNTGRPLPVTTMNLHLEIFRLFLRTGLVTLGNSHAGVTPVRNCVVTRRAWMTEAEFLDAVALVEAMPGVFSLNFSVLVGRRIGGWAGSVAAVAGTLLPVVVSFALLAFFLFNVRESAGMTAFLKGVRPAIVALVALPAIQLGRTAQINLSNVWLPVGTAVLVGLLGVSPVYVILLVALCGYLYGRYIRPVE